jgi:hypothetical protein
MRGPKAPWIRIKRSRTDFLEKNEKSPSNEPES